MAANQNFDLKRRTEAHHLRGGGLLFCGFQKYLGVLATLPGVRNTFPFDRNIRMGTIPVFGIIFGRA